MKMRNKLAIISAVLLVLSTANVAVYFTIQGQIAGLNSESRILAKFANAVTILQLRVNALASGSIAGVRENLKKDLEEYDQTFKAVKSLKSIPKLDEASRDAYTAVVNLHDLYRPQIDVLLNRSADLGERLDAIAPGSTSGGMLDYVGIDIAKLAEDAGRKNPDAVKMGFIVSANNMRNDLDIANETLTLAVVKASKTSESISSAVASRQSRGTLASILALALSLSFGIAMVTAIAARWASSIDKIDGRIALMSSGDLPIRLGIVAKDEMGTLSRNLDNFLEKVAGTVRSIQASSTENTSIGHELAASAEESSASTNQIHANVDSIAKQMARMDEFASKAAADASGMADIVRGFSDRITKQNSRTEESSSAVTQMLASIGSITSIAEKEKESAELMVVEAENGGRVIDDAFGKVADIGSAIGQIQEMVGIIDQIAGRTNLLAMNAAIEAAHAGEAGKGFAVVAEEIRTLAENSSESSKEISQSTQGIIQAITEAGASRDEAIHSFRQITDRIREVSSSIQEIYANVSEMKTGSDLILSAVTELGEQSRAILNESGTLGERSKSSSESMASLTRIAQEVSMSITEISTGLADIASSVRETRDLSVRVGEIGGKLYESANYFKIGG